MPCLPVEYELALSAKVTVVSIVINSVVNESDSTPLVYKQLP